MTLYGTSDPVELPPIFDRDDSGRWTTIRRWRGLQEDLQALADTFVGKVKISQEDAVWHLMEAPSAGLVAGGASPSPDEQVVTVYELDYAKAQRSHWLRPDVQAELAKITDPAGRAQFRSDITALARGERVVLNVSEAGRATQTALDFETVLAAAAQFGIDGDLFRQLASSLAAGDEEFMFEIPVLKVQRVTPPGSSIRAAFGGLNRFIATSTLLGRFPSMPDIIRDGIERDLAVGYWLINAPRVKTQDATRILVEEMYEYSQDYNQWSYGAPLTE
jgi:hypothetical protein